MTNHSNNYSKMVLAIYRTVLMNPGIRQDGVFKLLSKSKCPTHFNKCILAMYADRRIERVQEGHTFKLYLRGTVPVSVKVEPVRRGFWQENHPMNKARGEQFRMQFDEAFGLLYIDLKILSGVTEW